MTTSFIVFLSTTLTVLTSAPSHETMSPTPQPTIRSPWTSVVSDYFTLNAAVAYDDINDTILLVGGSLTYKDEQFIEGNRQFLTFEDHQYTDFGLEYLDEDEATYSRGQFYTQLDDVLWMVSVEWQFITVNTHSYDVRNTWINVGHEGQYGEAAFGEGGCVTSFTGFLIVIRGASRCFKLGSYDPIIYDLENEVWLSDVPFPLTLRRYAGCAVVSQKLYLIGGENKNCTMLNSIEVMDVAALPFTTALSWSLFPSNLSIFTASAVTAYGTNIYVISPLHQAGCVNIINTTGNYVVYESLSLPWYGTSTSAIVANDVLFAFGGWTYIYNALGPTRAPSPKPTSSPTKAPTSNTFNPSIPPTFNPSMMPSIPPTKIDTTHDASEDFDAIQYDRLDNLAMIHRWAFGGFILGIIVIALCAWIDAKCIPSRQNDYLQVSFIVGVALQTADMFSDCFFAINMDIWRRINPIYTYVLYLSIAFVVIPCAISIGQLLKHSRKHWFNSSDKVRAWLGSRSSMLYFASIITGSSFAAVSLCNSYFFQLEAFDMGLTKKEIQAFMYKRVYSVVVFENIPQLAMQSFFVYMSGGLDDSVTLSSMIFSSLSIIVSVLSMFTQRSISRGQGTVSISMTVTGQAVLKKASNCKRMKKTLIKELSKLVGVTQSTMEILKPVHVKQGFEITVQFTVGDSDQDFYRTLMEVQANSELQKIFKRAWDLSDVPIVSDLKQTVVQSKRERLDSESVSDGKGTTSEQKTGAGQKGVVNEMSGTDIPPPPSVTKQAVEIVYVDGPWNCSICTYSNNPSSNQCGMCNNPKN
eukprot:210929_1